jgi:hypothetical protein
MLESYIAALESTRTLIKSEQQRVQKEMAEAAEAVARSRAAATAAAAAAAAAASPGDAPGGLERQPSVDLATQLAELQGRLRGLDAELEAVRPLVAGAGGAREDERAIHETKLVVLEVRPGGEWCVCGGGGAHTRAGGRMGLCCMAGGCVGARQWRGGCLQGGPRPPSRVGSL